MKYRVDVIEKYRLVHFVEAESEQEAIDKAREIDREKAVKNEFIDIDHFAIPLTDSKRRS